MKSMEVLKDMAKRQCFWKKKKHITSTVHWFHQYLRFADHAEILEKPSRDRCVFGAAQIGLGWRRCCRCAMCLRPFFVTMQIVCRLFHMSLVVPCTNVTIQHGLKYAAWKEEDNQTKSSCGSMKISKTFQITFFFKGCYAHQAFFNIMSM